MGILAIGSIAFDTVHTPFGSCKEVLGGSVTYFSLAASHFVPVSLVAVVGEDFPETEVLFLQNHGVDISALQRKKGKTFRWEGEYDTNINIRRTIATHLNVFADFSPKILEQHRSLEYIFLGNIDPDLQQAVLMQMRQPKLVACDTMNYWIESKPESLLRTLSLIDILIVNDEEAGQIAGEVNLVKAAKKILNQGPKTIVIKRGEFGALMYTNESVFSAPGFPMEDVVDPTGAGDSFAGGFMGFLATAKSVNEQTLRRAVIYGSAIASLSICDFGPYHLGKVNNDEINKRYDEFYRLTRFDSL